MIRVDPDFSLQKLTKPDSTQLTKFRNDSTATRDKAGPLDNNTT